MHVIVIGVNHKTAPINVREKLAFSPDDLQQALEEIGAWAKERVIVSTCNRTELYIASRDGWRDAPQEVINWLSTFRRIDNSELSPCLYIHEDAEAVKHLLRVVSGLDSMILGEPQILGQVKSAHTLATDNKATGLLLNRLMQYSFAVAKRIRTQTAISANPVSVAYAAVSLAKQIFARLEKQTALLVGAGETIELVGRHLHSNGIKKIIVANRSLPNAQRVAQEFSGIAISLDALPEYLSEADILISSTAAPIPIIGKGSVERALKRRKHRPMFMVDIAVPRDVEPEVGELDDVYLYTVDDLQSVIEDNLKSRKAAAEQAEEMITQEVDAYMDWMRAQDQLALIRHYRSQAERDRDNTLTKALKLLDNGKPPEEVLRFLANTLTNKLLHDATASLNKAAHGGDHALLDAARRLLNLDKT